MRLPLPLETRKLLSVDTLLKKTSNLGLLFNKYVSVWSNDWTTEERRGRENVNLKSEFLNKIEKESVCSKEGKQYVDAIFKRQSLILSSLQSSGWHIESFTATTDSRLIIGLGGTSVIETGMTLHPLYGFPYLSASGLKGLARAYAEVVAEPKPSGDELREVFGSEDKNPHNVANNRQGKVFFIDGLPTQFPKLELDIMNPHYGDYYSKKTDSKGNPIPPADYLNPVPITFLAVAAGQGFSFAVYSRDKALADKAKEWLIGGLTELGAGGKTNVGYGYFKDVRSATLPSDTAPDSGGSHAIKSLQTAPANDNSLIVRLKTVKNPQTFTDFIKNIKDDETEILSDISFKGMESVINIGLLGVLEATEVSAEIKKIIARKMLDVCKEPDKKYAEKLEKYKKLQTIAEINKA